MSDRALLYVNAFLRSFGTGLVAVVLGIYLSMLELTPASTGGIVAAGLAGAAVASLIASFTPTAGDGGEAWFCSRRWAYWARWRSP